MRKMALFAVVRIAATGYSQRNDKLLYVQKFYAQPRSRRLALSGWLTLFTLVAGSY